MSSVCCTPWMRLIDSCTCGSKSCTPRLARLNPRRASMATSRVSMKRGSSSIEKSRCGESLKSKRRRSPSTSVVIASASRRATAQMQLDDLTAVLELRRQQVGLGQHARHIAVATSAVAGDHPVAATVEAGLEQNGTCTYSDSARASWLLSAIAWRSAGASKPSWKCGAVGYEVARARPVVPAQKVGVEGPGQATGGGRTCPCRQHRARRRLDPDQCLPAIPSTGRPTCGQRSIW